MDPPQLLERILNVAFWALDQRQQLVGQLDSLNRISLGSQSHVKGRRHMPREDERLVCEIHGRDVGLTPDQTGDSTLQFRCHDSFVEAELHLVFPS